MTTTQTRAGKKLSAATKQQLDDAQDHLKRAMERHKDLGDQMDNIREARDEGDADSRAEINDLHEDAQDAHRALGRSLKRCQRCLRAALKGKPKPADNNDDGDDDEEDTENSAGDGHEDDDDQRNADYRRRKADLRALSQKK